MLPIVYGPFEKFVPRKPLRELLPGELSRCENTVINDGHLELSRGWSDIQPGGDTLPTGEKITHIAEHRSPTGDVYFCIHTKTKFYVYNPTTATLDDVSIGGGYSSTDIWTSCSYGKWYVFANRTDATQRWDSTTPTTAAANIANAPKAAIVRTFGAYLIAANTDTAGDGPREIKWCSSSDMTDWTGSDAGFTIVYEGEGSIQDVQMLTRDTMVVYKEKSIHSLSFVGYPYYFATVNSMTGLGLVARRGAVRVDNFNVFMGTRGLMAFDGAMVRDYSPDITPLYDSLTQLQRDVLNKSLLYFDNARRQLWVLFSSDTTGTLNSALIHEVDDNSWTYLSGFTLYSIASAMLAITKDITFDEATYSWDSAGRIWDASDTAPALIVGGVATLLKVVPGTYTRAGATYTGISQTGFRNPAAELWQQPVKRSELVQIDMDIATGSPQVYVFVSDTPNGAVTRYGPYTAVNNRIFTTITGRWFSFELQSQTFFQVSGFEAYFVPRGDY